MNHLISVAVAVLCFDGEFLLARRHHNQHQGGKLEFVGGKIEQGEDEITALVREVGEELGLDIGQNDKQKLGQIVHDYGDKTVQLCVYQVALTKTQATDFKQKDYGLDGQSLHWLDQSELLARADDLPKANLQILQWLTGI